jgi:hypothetical protein
MPVFSASNLAYLGHGTGNTLGYLVKHFAHICIGFVIIYAVHRVPLSLFQGYFKMAFARCLDITDVYVNQRDGYSRLMPAGGQCLYWYIVSNINIGVCSAYLHLLLVICQNPEKQLL